MYYNVYLSSTGKTIVGYGFTEKAAARRYRDPESRCIGLLRLKEGKSNG